MVMDEPLSFRRTHRSTSSSSLGPLHRSRSASTLSTPLKQKDSTQQLSRIRDHDLKTNIEAKVQRIARSLTRRTRGEDSARSRVHRSTSFGRHPRQNDVVSASDDRQQTSSNYIDLTQTRTQPPYVLDKLPAESSSTALYQKATRLLMKDTFDHESLPTGRSFDRISYILEQLRREDPGSQAAAVTSPSQTALTSDDGHHLSSVRAELDSFAALLGKLSPGSAAGVSRGRSQTTARTDAEDFWARLAHSRGDLDQLEMLVGRTFGSTHHSSPRPTPTVSVEPVFIFHDKKPSLGRDDLIAFVTGNTADYKRSDPIAEMAIKWAQERREKIETELDRSREHEDHPTHWRGHVSTGGYDDDYVHPDVQLASATVTHSSPTMRYYRSHGTSSLREPTSSLHSYTRSSSASVTGLQPQQQQQQQQRDDEQQAWRPTTTFSHSVPMMRLPMSAARQRARSVLAKHGRRLSRL